MSPESIRTAVDAAIAAAEPFCGATAPNPPVGAAALTEEGELLGAAAHERAGRLHAEALLLHQLHAAEKLDQVHTLVVTLEPCNHTGRTPPCTEAIIAAGVKRVVYLNRDPNPVAAGGGQRLRDAGIDVIEPHEARAHLSEPSARTLKLQLGPFLKRMATGLPWITIKRAFDEQGSMIPPPGQKTFTSQASLVVAHLLRRRADAILTASGTVLADRPEFTVRHVPDHPGKVRALWIADRRGRVPDSYLHGALSRGLMAERVSDWTAVLREGVRLGALEVLVEAGPEFSSHVLRAAYWDRCVDIHRVSGLPDRIEDRLRV
jgi:diaminohydroxyphosphoribosylaminopyrimidine deaminase/5-amino-6-(5-phosphoribosylamino)uracil reductase